MASVRCRTHDSQSAQYGMVNMEADLGRLKVMSVSEGGDGSTGAESATTSFIPYYLTRETGTKIHPRRFQKNDSSVLRISTKEA